MFIYKYIAYLIDFQSFYNNRIILFHFQKIVKQLLYICKTLFFNTILTIE